MQQNIITGAIQHVKATRLPERGEGIAWLSLIDPPPPSLTAPPPPLLPLPHPPLRRSLARPSSEIPALLADFETALDACDVDLARRAARDLHKLVSLHHADCAAHQDQLVALGGVRGAPHTLI